MAVADVFNNDDKRKMIANPQGEQSAPMQNSQPPNSAGGAAGSVEGVDLQGRSRLNPNGDANAPQNGGASSDGSYTAGGGTTTSGGLGTGIGIGNEAITAARSRRDQVATNNPFRENGYYAKIFKETTPFRPPTADELRRSQRRERSQKIVSAIADGISSLSNLYFTTQYAPNAYNPQTSMSAASARRWEQLRKDRRDNTEKYIQGLMAAEARDDANTADRRNYEWNIYNAQAREAEADRDYAYRIEKDTSDREAAAAAIAEDKRRWEAEQKNKDRDATERSRHNRVMEGIGRLRAARSGGGSRRERITLRASDGNELKLPKEVWNDDDFINGFWEGNIKNNNQWNGRGIRELISATDRESEETKKKYGRDKKAQRSALADKRRRSLQYLLNGENGYDEQDIDAIFSMFDNIDNVYNEK